MTEPNQTPLRIGIIAGETSGDILGAGLIRALRASSARPLELVGVGGPQMLAEGFHSLFDMERLAVMGFVEPLKRLPELLSMRAQLRRHFLDWHADIVIGIDAPDFNLGLELWLRRRGIRTAHYVSPSVWAWRQGRIHKIKRAVDLMLTLFPFEEQFYRDHGVPVVCVGHPLADQLPLQPDVAAARAQLGIAVGPLDAGEISGTQGGGEPEQTVVESGHPAHTAAAPPPIGQGIAELGVVALLPGSRGSEVAQLGAVFLETAVWLHARRPGLRFLLPAANAARRAQIEAQLSALGTALPLTVLDGQSQRAMTAADVVLMASGTTTLEALLLKKPMVVAYKMGKWSFALISRLVKVRHVALPNLLAGRELVPERLQDDARAEVLGPLLLERLDDKVLRARLGAEFLTIHQSLRRAASARAAAAILDVVEAGAVRS